MGLFPLHSRFVSASHLVSSMLLQLLVELQGDANHHFSFIPVGVGDVVQDAIEICRRDKPHNHNREITSVDFTQELLHFVPPSSGDRQGWKITTMRAAAGTIKSTTFKSVSPPAVFILKKAPVFLIKLLKTSFQISPQYAHFLMLKITDCMQKQLSRYGLISPANVTSTASGLVLQNKYVHITKCQHQ